MEVFLWIAFVYLLLSYLSDRKKVKQLHVRVKKLQKYQRRKSDVCFIERIGRKKSQNPL